MSQSSQTSKSLEQLTLLEITSSPRELSEDCPANPLVVREDKKEQPIVEIYSPTSSDYFAQFDPDGQLLKTCQDSLQLTLDGSFEIFAGKFPKSGGMTYDGKLYHAPLLEDAIKGKDFGLSLRERSSQSNKYRFAQVTSNKYVLFTLLVKSNNLKTEQNLLLVTCYLLFKNNYEFRLPTPKHSDRFAAGVKKSKPKQQQHLSATIREILTIDKTDNRLLNPEFVEADSQSEPAKLPMGFPIGWTDTEIENKNLPPPHLITRTELPEIIEQGLTENSPNLRTRLGQLGNSIVPQVGAIAFNFLTKILEEQDKMLALQEMKLKIANLQADLEKAKTKTKKEAINKQIAKLNRSLEKISAYDAIQINDVVRNGSPKLGTVTAKEIQNDLPVVWVDWDGTQVSSTPDTLTVIPPEQLQWQWIEGDFIRTYDRKFCDDIESLITELERLRGVGKVLASSTAYHYSSNPIKDKKEIEDKVERIIELWQDAIAFHYPLGSGFFLHNRKVVVKSYQLSKQHDLVFPVVFDGQCNHLAHPLELKRILLGQINMFREDNSDPNEPDDPSEVTSNKEQVASKSKINLNSNDSTDDNNTSKLATCYLSEAVLVTSLTIDPEFKALLRPLTTEEYEQLEKNLIKDRAPVITVWKGHNVIIDGHHSYKIASQHNIPYTVREIELESRSAVIQWMYDLQLGRRNLTEEEKSYYRAKQYELLKQERGGDRNKERKNQYTVLNNDSRSKGHCDPLTKTPIISLNTAQTVAEKTGVSEKTVKRDAKYAQAVDVIASKVNCSPQDIINSPLSKKQVKEMVNLPVEVIEKKLKNPSFIDPNEFPELKEGDVVRIKSDRKNGDFIGYNRQLAIVDTVYENSCDLRVWQKLIPHVSKQFLVPVEGDTVTLKLTVSKVNLKNLMVTFNSIEDAIVPF